MEQIRALASDERTARMLLAAVCEPGDGTTGRLLVKVGAVEVLDLATPSSPVRGVDGAELTRWRRHVDPRLRSDDLSRVLSETERLGLDVLVPGDRAWPRELADLQDQAPVALWARGNSGLLATPERMRVGIVGARAATAYGEHVAGELAADLSNGERVVVSGGAYGIDATAHRAALAVGRPTIAILAGGLDRYYPAGNQELLERVGKDGLLVSEAAPGAAPSRSRFLQRNRLLAAVSEGVVVVEAGYRSRALNTASRAARLGRPVGAVPGPVTSAASAGCHRLLREGIAGVITNAEDVTRMLADQPGAARAGRASGRVMEVDRGVSGPARRPETPGLSH